MKKKCTYEKGNKCKVKGGLSTGGQGDKGAKQIARHLDKIPHTRYVEPFLGAGAVFRLKKTHPKTEILNDLDCKRAHTAKKRDCSIRPNKQRCDLFKKARISCGNDYKSYLKRYDKKDTLIYLDPPYHNVKDQAYKQKSLDFPTFAQNVKQIRKANVAVSYSENKDFRREFCNQEAAFKCHRITKNLFANQYHELLAVKKRG